jgi:hypothetical protein
MTCCSEISRAILSRSQAVSHQAMAVLSQTLATRTGAGIGPSSTGCWVEPVRRFISEVTIIIRAVNGTYGGHDGNTEWAGRGHMSV